MQEAKGESRSTGKRRQTVTTAREEQDKGKKQRIEQVEISDTSDSQGEVRAHGRESGLGEDRTYPKTRTPLTHSTVGLTAGEQCTE